MRQELAKFEGPITLRLGKKSEKTGIGMPRLKAKTGLRPVSDKKKKTMKICKSILHELLALEHELYGCEFCQLKYGFPELFKTKCDGPFNLEHIESWRDQEKTNILRLQVSCEKHNLEKGSKNLDGRSDLFKKTVYDRFGPQKKYRTR